MAYNEQDRDRHYLARVEQTDCPLCFAGLIGSHGAGLNPETIARLGERWWSADRLEQSEHASKTLQTFDAQSVPFTVESMPAYDAAERATIARERLAMFEQKTDDLINELGDAIEHEACAWTLKASSGEILDHLMTLLELGSDSTEAKRCGRDAEPVGWWDASIIVDGALDESLELTTQDEIDELVKKLDELSSDGKSTELYLLRHDHAELGELDDDTCVQYLTDHHPYRTWNIEEVR